MSTSDVFGASTGLRAYACETLYSTRLNVTEQRASDAGPRRMWDLELILSDTDVAPVLAMFAAHGGPYESFVFLDPVDNLLKWSEDVAQAAWEKSEPSFLPIVGTRLTNTGA